MPDNQTTATLTADFVRTFPGGVLDDSAYSDIEAALDRCDAPCQDAGGKWLKLPDRVLALARELGREAEVSDASNETTSQDDEFIELVTRLNDAARICAEQVVSEAAGHGENRSIFLRAVISRLKDAT